MYNPTQKRHTSTNRICEQPWQESNLTSQMKVKRISYQGVLSFLSLEGINHDTYYDDKANCTGATGTNEEENHHNNHNDMVTAANGEDEPHSDNPKTSSLQLVDDTQPSTIPATIILHATISPPPTTSLDAASASTRSSGSSNTSSQSNEPTTPASDDPNPTLQERCKSPLQILQKTSKPNRKPHRRN
jgi:hypothetical protein